MRKETSQKQRRSSMTSVPAAALNKVYEGVKEDAQEALADAKELYAKASDKAKEKIQELKEKKA